MGIVKHQLVGDFNDYRKYALPQGVSERAAYPLVGRFWLDVLSVALAVATLLALGATG